MIVDRIENIQEEWVVRTIEKLLDIEDHDKSPEWHMGIVMESSEEYKSNPIGAVKWEDLKKEWDNDL